MVEKTIIVDLEKIAGQVVEEFISATTFSESKQDKLKAVLIELFSALSDDDFEKLIAYSLSGQIEDLWVKLNIAMEYLSKDSVEGNSDDV